MTGGRPIRPPENRSMLHFMMAGVWDMLWGRKFPFFDTDTVKVIRQENGYGFQAFPPGAAGKSIRQPTIYKQMAIKSLGSGLTPSNPELLICSSVTVSGGVTSIGNDTIYVAKRREMRRIATEFFYDDSAHVVQSYTYFGPTSADASYGDNFRTASDGTNSELESATPRYYTVGMMIGAPAGGHAIPPDQSFIIAVDLGVATGVKDPNNADVTIIEVTPRF